MIRESERIYIAGAYKIITTLALVMHITFTVLFGLLHITEMIWYNVASTLLYALFLLMLNKRLYRTVVTLIHLEVCGFVVCSTLFLGWDYGFSLYLIAMTSLIYFNPFDRHKVIFLFPILEIAAFFLLKLFTTNRIPYLEADSQVAA